MIVRRALIVEDQVSTALILKGNMRRAAAALDPPVALDVRVAHTAADAIRQAQRDMPDLVLLDLVLLGSAEDGEAVLRQVRTNGGRCRVVVLSGLHPANPADARRLDDLRALRPDAILPKPSSPAAIAAALFPPGEVIP